MSERGETTPNRLANESSPYLQQHAHNPVDWYPWGEEALQRAREEDRPILLSVGYAACHWCHVMEHESFESPAIAELMNKLFVNIKVDREERPDVDDVYMRAVQMMTGRGGWPMTVFLTPELEPFFGGTYFPPEPRHGMPGFPDVLAGVAQAYAERRDEVAATGAQLREHLQPRPQRSEEALGAREIYKAVMAQHDNFDPNYGGFGGAPKFPHTTGLMLHLRYAVGQGDPELLQEVIFSLRQMAGGGIRDHVGGGFHRYAVDAQWLVPHFEKMLYDNALLAVSYLEAFQHDGSADLAAAARTTLDWVRREMQDERGGYYSTLDADSEGVEGKYYVWSLAEVEELLGDEAPAFAAAYDVTAEGNWEGSNIANTPRPLSVVANELGRDENELREQLGANLETLRQAREARIRPGLDDKILSDWNGLMIAAMARGYRVLGDPDYLQSARDAADFVLEHLTDEGRLLHSCRGEQIGQRAFLDDYANMLWACIELFEATFERRWLAEARRLADGMIELFWDEEEDGFYFTGNDQEILIARPKSGHDGATPSGNAIAATWLARLARWTGEPTYARKAGATMQAFAEGVRRAPTGFAQLLLAATADIAENREVVIRGADGAQATHEALQQLWTTYTPDTLIAWLDPSREDVSDFIAELPLLEGKLEAEPGVEGLMYACRGYACAAPTTDVAEVIAELGAKAN
ncbi:MAG: DUF255 domain-containing protein [Acidobacteria bacterium]|nr:DUF255 domain-containing protein [Acidobacteriota bacterium]